MCRQISSDFELPLNRQLMILRCERNAFMCLFFVCFRASASSALGVDCVGGYGADIWSVVSTVHGHMQQKYQECIA